MADKIKLLPEAVANQIAAGEVVNRPSSVVKEMMENAVDAGAGNVTVNFRDGGKALIQIVDDGTGMSPVDARLAFDRHATSKIDSVDDIYRLVTFGFRGEALASIASVAEVELRTRQSGQEMGVQVEIAGGKFMGQKTISTPVGSQFMVRNLFYNVPARRRFLEKSSTESRHITAEYQRVALCNPQVGFALYDNDALVSKLIPGTLRQRVVGVIGKSIARNLLDVSARTSIVGLEGFVGRPASARQSNKEQFLFVNGRYFKSPYFHSAVISAFEKLIPAKTQPSYFLFLEVDPERIDVNVHPQKTEVKFEDGNEIWQIINAAVREALAKSGAVPPMDFDLDTSIEIPVYKPGASYGTPRIQGNPDFNPFREDGDDYADDISSFLDGGRPSGASDVTPRGTRGWNAGVWPPAETTEEDYGSSVLEFIEGEGDGQLALEVDEGSERGEILIVGRRYAVYVKGGALVLTDIARACETLLYDRYRQMIAGGSSVSQQMLFPERVTLSIDDASLLGLHMEDFASFGFDILFIDEHTVELRGVPADLLSLGAPELLYELLDAVREEEEAAGKGPDTADTTDSDPTSVTARMKQHRLALAMARMGALSRSKTMNRGDVVALVDSLAQCDNPSYTPSGKPVTATLGIAELASLLRGRKI